jgi:hypothetical protein
LRTSRLKGSFSRPMEAAMSSARVSGLTSISSSVARVQGPRRLAASKRFSRS